MFLTLRLSHLIFIKPYEVVIFYFHFTDEQTEALRENKCLMAHNKYMAKSDTILLTFDSRAHFQYANEKIFILGSKD